MGVACEFCGQEDGHAVLCPMTFVAGDANRKVAFDMGVPVSTSDWIDAWLKASQGQPIETLRETLTELFTLHHRYVDRITERRVKHELGKE